MPKTGTTVPSQGEAMKTGLVLEGGAMRGLFTAGVLDVLMENKITFDGVIGVSAGAAFGCNFKSGQIGRAVRYNVRFCRDRRYCGLGSLWKTGDIFNTDFCYGEVPLKLDPFDFDAFEKDPTDFYVVCTDVETGQALCHRYTGREDHGFDWIRASASMPLVSRMVEIEGRKLLDGGIADSIPASCFESMGYTRNVVILTRPEGYRKKKNQALPLIRRKYRAYPRLVEAMEQRHLVYNAELDYVAQAQAEGRMFVIRPEKALSVRRIEKNPERLRAAYEEGRKTAERQREALSAFLGQQTNA